MSLKYVLRPHVLSGDPNAYVASALVVESKTLDDVIDEMIRSGSTVTRAEAFSVLEEYSAAVEAMLRQGHSVNTPLLQFRLSVQGIFYGGEAPFDPARHQVRVNVHPGARLRQVEPLVEVERVVAGRAVPQPLDFDDVASGTRNAQLTPGGLGRLTGLRLKYTEADPQQGVFFIDAAGTATRVAMIVRNMPRELNFLIPDTLASGAYAVEVRAELNDTGAARTGLLPHQVTVP